ncbi:MAG TPA: GntR family transcriptional regulator [Chthonomonadaceae bacterium]|nr:GntR family transcriptional regulator [Chthonomonadaceae bacterium]
MPSDTTHKRTRSLSPIPAYQRIEEDIQRKVQDGRLPAGAMLASRHNLAKEYGVALSTVQQAIANLIADGTLETSARRGTFVARNRRVPDEAVVSPVRYPTGALRGQDIPHSSTVLPDLKTAPTLGIVSTARIREETEPDVGSLWARLAIRSLEQVISQAGGANYYFDRFPERLGPYDRGFDDANAISMSEAIDSLRAEGVQALAVIGLCDSRDMSDEILACVDIERVPTVYVSWHQIRPPLAQVYYDNRYSGYQAAQHLLRRGYQRFLFLAPFLETWLPERIEGARDAVRHARLPRENLQVYPAEPPQGVYYPERVFEAAYQAAQRAFAECEIFADPDRPWGVIAPNDAMAYGVMEAAADQGKTPGSDYGLVGFDDDARSCTVGLTTVRPPVEAMGEEAARLLLRTLQGENSGLRVCLRSQVIPRASTSLRRGSSSDS